MDLDIKKLEDVNNLLNEFFEVKARIERLNLILATDRKDESMRNIAGFLVSPTLYYSIYEQIKSEYMSNYNKLKSLILTTTNYGKSE